MNLGGLHHFWHSLKVGSKLGSSWSTPTSLLTSKRQSKFKWQANHLSIKIMTRWYKFLAQKGQKRLCYNLLYKATTVLSLGFTFGVSLPGVSLFSVFILLTGWCVESLKPFFASSNLPWEHFSPKKRPGRSYKFTPRSRTEAEKPEHLGLKRERKEDSSNEKKQNWPG